MGFIMRTDAFLSALLTFSLSCLPFALSSLELSPERGIEQAWMELEEQILTLQEGPARGRLVKIRDLVDISGEESVKLSGFGIVSGLQKSGDSSSAAKKMMIKVARDQGILLKEEDLAGNNLALVSLSAEVNPHQRRFDLAVKSIGDAKSLQNGFLEASTLSPIGSSDVYAVASGSVALGSRYFEAEGSNSLSSVTIGHPTMGFVLQGGELIEEIPTYRLKNGKVNLYLKHPSNRTATHVANSVNQYLKPLQVKAEPKNASTIVVHLPAYFREAEGRLTRLLADLGDLPSKVSRKAQITIDQGSGIITMTNDVKMEPGSLTIGGLTVTVTSDLKAVVPESPEVAADLEELPKPELVNEPKLTIEQQEGNVMLLPAGTSLRKVQETFNAIKITPETMMSVFTAMHNSGMIHADIVVIPR